jgi:hypothetical protein
VGGEEQDLALVLKVQITCELSLVSNLSDTSEILTCSSHVQL